MNLPTETTVPLSDKRAELQSEKLRTAPVRVVGFDVARCLAILSMVYVNFEVVLAGGRTKPEWLRTLATAFEGNASATFVTLAGVGIVLLGKRAVIFKRALLLLVVGYLWQLLWSGDILHYYAFYLTGGALCLSLRARWLWLAAAVSVGGWLVALQWFDYGAGWRWLTLTYPEFWTWTGQLRNLLFNGWHPLFPWLGFLFAGMAIAKWRIQEPRRRRVALVVSAVIYAAAYSASQYLTQLPDERPWLQQLSKWYMAPASVWGMDSIPPGPFYMVSAGAVAVFWIALCLELTSRPALAKVATPLVRCGQLALTFYLAHVLVLHFVIPPLFEGTELAPLEVAACSALGFALGAIALATLWRQWLARGPLEWVMRKLCG